MDEEIITEKRISVHKLEKTDSLYDIPAHRGKLEYAPGENYTQETFLNGPKQPEKTSA